jgi:hypothetical protein
VIPIVTITDKGIYTGQALFLSNPNIILVGAEIARARFATNSLQILFVWFLQPEGSPASTNPATLKPPIVLNNFDWMPRARSPQAHAGKVHPEPGGVDRKDMQIR